MLYNLEHYLIGKENKMRMQQVVCVTIYVFASYSHALFNHDHSNHLLCIITENIYLQTKPVLLLNALMHPSS